jgi:hypothetical protein
MKSLSHWLSSLRHGSPNIGKARKTVCVTKKDRPNKRNCYQSLLWLESEQLPGVQFSLRKISLSQRIELSSRARELTHRNEFLKAGDLTDQMDARFADLMVEKLYLEWAVSDIEGLKIDGAPATVELLIERGPDVLANEMIEAIRSQLELSDAERKNS